LRAVQDPGQPQGPSGQPPGQPPPPQAPPPGAAPTAQETGQPTLAIVALVTGIASILTGWCCLGVPASAAAIVCGILGRRQAEERGVSTTMATVGLVLGIIGLVIVILLFAVGVATTDFDTSTD
jgi:hypothetical protein